MTYYYWQQCINGMMVFALMFEGRNIKVDYLSIQVYTKYKSTVKKENENRAANSSPFALQYYTPIGTCF